MANSTTNLNSAGDSLYHLRRIGPPATADEVVNIMDFYKSTYMIGRNAARVDFYLNSSSHIQSQSLSRCHARIVRQAGNKHRIYDDSLNGVYINNMKISGSCILNEGDTVTFGHPRGAHLPAGSRSRQPNSEYQFIFGVCSCTDQKDQPSNANKPAFKKPVSPRVSSPESSQTSPKVSSRHKSSVEKESLDETSEGNVSTIETVCQSGNSENTDTNSGLINQLIEAPQNKSETEEILENQSVTMEKEIGGNDNQIHSEVCNKVHNAANSKADILEVATAKSEITVNKVKSIEVATGVISEKHVITKTVEDMDVDSDSEAKISELEITANSILSDLCAIREGVENNCTRRQSLDPEQFKSPTKDMGIQTTQGTMNDILSPTKEMGIQTTQRDMSYILSPTKEMGIQTSQGVFNDTVNVCNQSDGATEIRNLFTSHDDLRTEVDMKDCCVGNTLNHACSSDLFENKDEGVQHEHTSVDNSSVSNIAEDNQISEVDNIPNNAENCKNPHNEQGDKLSHTENGHVNNIQCIEEIENYPPIETVDANLPSEEMDKYYHNSMGGEEDINPQSEEVDEKSIADKENYVQLSEAESSVEIDCAQANVENDPDNIDGNSDKISPEHLDSGSSEATSSVSEDNVNDESGISDEEVECVVLPKVDTDIGRSFLVDKMKSCTDSPHLSLSDSIAYDIEDNDNGGLNYVPSNSVEFDDDYGSYHEDSDRKSVDSENKSGDHVELEEASSLGTAKINSENIFTDDEVGFEQTVDSLEETSCNGSEIPNNVETEERTNDDKVEETLEEGSENLICTELKKEKDREKLLSNNKISCDKVSPETCPLESGTECVSDNEVQHDIDETCRKRKMSSEISDVESDDDNVRKRHCSENVDTLDSIKEFPDTGHPIISGDSDPVIPDADKEINGDDGKEMTSSDIVNRKTLDKFKDGVKQFFTTWSKKSDVSTSPERTEYVYVQDGSGKVKQLHLDVPKIVKSNFNELGQLEGRSNEDAVEDNSAVLDNIKGDVVISPASKTDKIDKPKLNAYNDSKAIQEVPENENKDALIITGGHKNKVEKTNNIDEISDGKHNDVENNDGDESGNNEEVLENNINDSGRNKDNSEKMDEHSEIIEEYTESIVTENEDKMSAGNEENKADDFETYVTSSQIGEDMETGNGSENNLYPAVKMSPWKQKLLNDVPRSSDSDMSPEIEKYEQKESSCDKNKTTTWLSSLPLQGSKPDKLDSKADQYGCEFSDEENDDEFEFPSPDIDFSYYSDKDDNDGDVYDEDDAASEGSSNGSNDENNLGTINNVGTNSVNDGMNDGCSETVSVKKVENLKKADIEQNDVPLVDTFIAPDAENELVCIDKVCHSEKIIDDNDVVSQIVSVVNAKSETGNGKTVNNSRKYINGDGDVISIDSFTDDAESDLEELLDCSKKSNDQSKAINKSFELEFDFCDSQSESDDIKALDNGANVREKDSKRKSDPHPQEAVTKKSKTDSNDVDHDESTNEEFVTPFKTPAVSRHKLNVSNHQSPGSVSCTQLMESSQSPDLNSLSLTQISTIKDQLEVKANDKSRVKESRNKAKSLIEKLRARKRVKEEANTDFPSNSTDDEVGSTSIETSSDTCSTSAVDTQVAEDDINQHVSSCRNVIDQLKSMFSRNVKLQDNPRVQAWRRELSEVEKRIEFAKTVIAVVGDTGAGKSSLMNAVLDHRSVLPTSGMRACTAVVVEVVANTTSNEFVADIEFLQKKEWFDELEVLLNDLKGLDGTIKNRPPDPTSDAYVSYCKVKAVYGKIDEFRILSRLTMVTHWLGKVKVVRSRRAEDFRKQVEKYIETQEPTGGGQYWPIVKHVTLKIPNCDVCSTGASLVDLPGVRDSNAARDKIAREYLKRCTAVWVVSSIHRAIDDKTAKDLLGENFRRQLLMDGQYGSIAFICTKTDVIIPSEIIRSLHLEGDTKDLEDEIKTMEAEKCDLDLKIMRHPKEVKSLNKQIEETRQEVEELQETLSELKSLLEGAEEETSQSEEKEAIQEYEGELKQKQDEITTMENQLESLLEENQFSTQKVLELEGRLNVKRKTIAAMCAKARNEYSKSQIRRDFKAGLKEMKRRAGMLDENEEEDIYDDNDDDDDDDDGDIGSSADNLKVFCCSSTEYQKMKNLLTDDGPPQVFSELMDTQIPALRLYVHEMTSVRRKQSLERLIRNLGSFVFDVQTYLSESGDTKFKNRQFVKSVIDSELQKFTSSLEPVIQQLISDIDEVFDGSIKQKLQQGASNASSEANDTCHKWGAPMNRDKSADRRSGGLHFSTYRATVRRHGAFKSPTFGNVDFNEELSEPMYRSMTIVWDRAFSGLLWKLLDKIQASILGQIKLHCRQLSNQLVQLGIPRDRVNRVSAQLEGSASNKLLEMVGQLKDTVTNRQRDISRLITPHIQTSLTPVYDQCAGESGPGMYNRIKTCVSQGIDTRRTTMFDQATMQLMQALIDLQDEIIQYVRQVSGVILGDLRTAFEPLWDTPGNSHVLKAAFMNQMLSTCSEVRQLYTAAGLRNTEERSASTSTQSGASHNNVSSVCAPSTSSITVPSARTLKVKIEPSTSCSGRTTCMNTTLPISTSFIKQEKTGTEQSRADASTSNFGIQTLQDLQAGHLDISPVEVTVNTTPTYNIIPSHRDISVHSIARQTATNQQCTSNQNIPSSTIRVPVFNSTRGGHPTIQSSHHTISSVSDYASLMTQQGRQSVLYTGQPLPSGTVIIPVSSAGKQGVKVVNVPMKSIIKTEFINKENMASVPVTSSQTRLLNSSQTKVKTEKPSKTSLSLSQRNSPANTRTIPKIFIKTEPADNAPTGRCRPKYLGTIDLTDD